MANTFPNKLIFDAIKQQMDFLTESTKKTFRKIPVNYEEEKEKMVENETDKIIEEDKEDNETNQEETLCGKPHDGCDMSEENCGECFAIKHNI